METFKINLEIHYFLTVVMPGCWTDLKSMVDPPKSPGKLLVSMQYQSILIGFSSVQGVLG